MLTSGLTRTDSLIPEFRWRYRIAMLNTELMHSEASVRAKPSPGVSRQEVHQG